MQTFNIFWHDNKYIDMTINIFRLSKMNMYLEDMKIVASRINICKVLESELCYRV